METLLTELIKAIKASKTTPEQVDLPIFRPDVTDAKKWIAQIETIKNEFEWSDQQILVRVGRFLTKVSKAWFDSWSPEVRDWETFQRDFVAAFPPKKNLGRLLSEATAFNSNLCNSYDAYVYEKAALLKNLRAQWEEADLVELIVHGIQERDVQTTASNHNFKKISELLTFLGSVSKPHKDESSTSKLACDEPLRKRFRGNHINSQPNYKGNRSDLKCFGCGKLGHLKRNCLSDRKRNHSFVRNDQATSSTSHVAMTREANTEICNFCAKAGHNADACFTRKAIERRKNVKICSAGRSPKPNKMKIDGANYLGIIDTGADISLMSKRFIARFEHKLEPCQLVIKGILPGSICVDQEFTATVEISNETTSLKFALIPDCFLDYDVIIGRNLYDDSELASITDCFGTRVVRNQTARIFRVLPEFIGKTSIDVPDEYYSALMTVLSHFPKIFASGSAVPPVNNTTLQIRLRDDFIVNRNPYRMSASERKAVRDIIEDLLKNHIIRDSESEFASPILLVRKNDGSYRMCVDYRELNSHTIKDRYPLPLIDDQLDRLGKGKFFTSLDMSSGFHQIPIDESSIHKTAFITPDGHYEYLRTPFGLANAPAVFQRSVNKALGNLKNTMALVYLDDILIPSESVEQGLQFLEAVLTTLQQAGFSLNMKKCHFLQSKLEYLGREISAEGIRPGTRKIDALVKVPSPTTVKQVRQFMGLAGYFRKFVPKFATRTACITKLTKSKEPFAWTEEQEIARKYVLDHLISRPLLSVFDPSLPTELHTDASSIGYGGILLQKSDCNPRIIGYFSKKTSPTEEKYHSYELETLAVVNSLKHFRVYLLGIQFTLVTDCNAIKSTATKKDILPRVARWWSYMQDFNFTIVYRKGSSLPHVDFLSRNPVVVRRIVNTNHWLLIEQRGDAEIRNLINDSKEGKLDTTRYVIRNGILHYVITTPEGKVPKPFVPRQSRLGLLRIFHDEQCHIGTDKTIDSIQKHFWFPRLRHFVSNYIKHCLVCAVKKTRTGRLQGFISNVQKPSEPMHVLHADCLGPLPVTVEGYKHVLVLIDAFTKYCMLQPLKTVKTDETKLAFQLFISLFGTPQQITMDAGSNFKNLSMPEYLDSLGITYHYTTPDVHRSNGQVERYMRTIMNLIRIETSIKSEWSSGLWKIQLVLNSTVHKTTRISPLKALIGIDGATPLIQNLLKNLSTDLRPIRNLQLDRNRVKERLDLAASKQIKANEKRTDTSRFAVGDFVLMHRDEKMHQGKLKYEFQGPYEIVGITPEGRYELRRVGKTLVTKAAKEQLRQWPSDWSLTLNIPDLLEELDDNSG
jgi:reverse transcriptase-like protein/integrase-like protein/aspartyl protease